MPKPSRPAHAPSMLPLWKRDLFRLRRSHRIPSFL